ncbi:hypothetical protein SFUMM280S_11508 [Streptomyces fumanus]
MLRLTWVQPEDLVGHELRQAAQDGRDATAVARRWRAAGGGEAPARAGASPEPASPYLRSLAEELLDELAGLPSPLAADEPTGLADIRARCPDWPAPLPPGEPLGPRRLEAAWLGRAVGCLLGKPVAKLPLDGIRRLARATGNWPLTRYFTARGVPPELAARAPLEPPLGGHLPRREHRRDARGRRPELPPAQPAAPAAARPRLPHRRRGPPLAGRTAGGPHLHRRTRRLPQPPRRPRPRTPPGTATPSASGSAP